MNVVVVREVKRFPTTKAINNNKIKQEEEIARKISLLIHTTHASGGDSTGNKNLMKIRKNVIIQRYIKGVTR